MCGERCGLSWADWIAVMTDSNHSLEKLKIWLGFAKTVIISGAVAIIIVVLNNKITTLQLELEDRRAQQELEIEAQQTKRELDLQRLEIENGYLAQFVQEALGENLERRKRFAQYFAFLTAEDAARARWLSYLDQVQGEIGETSEVLSLRIAELEDALAEAEVDDQTVNSLRAEIRRLESEVTSAAPRVSANYVALDIAILESMRNCRRELGITEEEVELWTSNPDLYIDNRRAAGFRDCFSREQDRFFNSYTGIIDSLPGVEPTLAQ